MRHIANENELNRSEKRPAEAEKAFRDKPNDQLSNQILNQKEAFRNRLIFHVDKATRVRRLYVPDNMVKDILDIVYTAKGHLGFARCFERVSST